LAKAITFAGISVRMRSCILAQVIENLSRWYVMCSECSSKLVPGDDVIGRLHRMKLIPPKTGSASELLGYKEHPILI
jgi:hypothetical protein